MTNWNSIVSRTLAPFALFVVASAGLAVVAQSVVVATGASSSVVGAVASILIQIGGAGVVLLAYAVHTGEIDTVRVRELTGRQLAVTAVTVVVLLVVNLVFMILLSQLPIESAQNATVTQGLQNPVLFLYLIPISVLIIAPVEEFLFRGLVQGSLSELLSPSAAVGIASVLFGISHAGALSATDISVLPYVAVATVLGIILGVAYEKEETILVPILAHGVYNAVLFTWQWFVIEQTTLLVV